MKLPNSVLLVDDDKIMRTVYSRVLHKMGITEVQTAENGEIAIKKYSSYNFDFVILDIRMPKMDGLEALKKIRVLNPGATVIMFTSISERHFVEECIDNGAYDYVLKSENIDSFKEKLIDIFSKKKVYWQISRNSPARLTAKLEEDLFEEEYTSTQEQELETEESRLPDEDRHSAWADKINKTIEE